MLPLIEKGGKLIGISDCQAHVQHEPLNQQRRLSSCAPFNHGAMYRIEKQHQHDCQMRGGVIFHWRLLMLLLDGHSALTT